MAFNVAKLLQKKRDGGELEDDEINFLVSGFVDGKVPDYQMSAFLAFVYCKGMNTRETQVFAECDLFFSPRFPPLKKKVIETTSALPKP